MSSQSLTIADCLALLVGKLSTSAIRWCHVGMASNLPGKLARHLSKNILKSLAHQSRLGSIAVTGTNGKSTTSGLLSSIFSAAGYTVVHNRQGANLVTGITASLIDAANWQGQIDADYGLFEIDEAALPVVASEVILKAIVVTNLFRDQLDRFGELDTTAKLIAKGLLQNKSKAILNADDPNVSQLLPEYPSFYYGIESSTYNTIQTTEHLAELSYCNQCGCEIVYENVTYGQLGNWHCSKCPHKRPSLNLHASNIKLGTSSSTFTLTNGGYSVEIDLELPGLFNIYNAIAAGAAASMLGITMEAIKDGISEYKTLFGRSERVLINHKSALIQLIKNPAGATQTVNAVVQGKPDTVLIAINDNLADGRDVSWLWDAEFEPLAQLSGSFVVSGHRAQDMALRLKYGGVPAAQIVCIPNLNAALLECLKRSNENTEFWILPTYTCLLELQKLFKKFGVQLSGT